MKSKTCNLKSKIQSGQSLVEMIIAIAIILTGLIGAIALTISNLTGSAEAGTRVVATNLAKEGIEVARNIRDTNWLKNLAWDNGLYSGTDYTAIAVFNPATKQWSLDFSPASVTDAAAKLYLSTGNLYLQDVNPPAGQATLYSRLITLDPICLNGTSKAETITGSACGAGETKIGIRVKAEVAWSQSGRARSLTVEDRIYNWR
jgi:Tfp pilus assembly protein PilV